MTTAFATLEALTCLTIVGFQMLSVDSQVLLSSVYCPDPGFGNNTVRMQGFGYNFTAGDTADYNCSAVGYDIYEGHLTMTCVIPGVWSGSTPSCDVVDCGHPGFATYGNVMITTTKYLGLATYACSSNMYEFNPPGHLTPSQADDYVKTTTSIVLQCQADKTWNDSLPECRRRDCGPPPALTGITAISSGTQVGDIVAYTANSGYRLSGTSILVCGSDRSWFPANNPIVTVVQCALPSLVDNIVWADNTTDVIVNSCNTTDESNIQCPYATIITQQCESAFVEGTSSGPRHCQDDGTWSGTSPTCQKMSCSPVNKTTSTLIIDEPSTIIGSIVTYECARGYEDSGIGDKTRTCLGTGNWSGEEPVCIPKPCLNVTFQPNVNSTAELILSTSDVRHLYTYVDDLNSVGEVTVTGATYGQYVKFHCVSGSRWARGAGAWRCQSDGTWDTTAPIVCKPDIELPGINTMPPDSRVEAENAENLGRLMFIILCAIFGVTALVDSAGMMRQLSRRLQFMSDLKRVGQIPHPSVSSFGP